MNSAALQLADLRDLHTPALNAGIAVGWWVLLIVLLLSAALVWWWRRRQAQRHWQREAQAIIADLRARATRESSSTILADCSVLARRLALLHAGRARVASLHGEDWLRVLDDICQQPLFTGGLGRLLLDHPYRASPDVSARDLGALLDVMETLALAGGRRSLREVGG